MPGTVNDVVNSVIIELSQVPGLTTQIYSTSRIQQFVQNAITLELEEMWWPPLMWRQLVPLDPATGLLNADLKGPISYIDEYGDIAAVYPQDRNNKIPELPQSINPFAFTSSSQRPRFIEADSTLEHRPFRVWPLGISGSVAIWARQRLTLPLSPSDKTYIDPLLLLYDACWMYAVDDGTVPAQVNKYQVLATSRRKKMISRYSQHPLTLDPRFDYENLLDTGDSDFFVLDQDPLA